MSRKLTTSEFEERLKSIHGERFTLLSEYVNNVTKVKLKCNVCGSIIMKAPCKVMTKIKTEGCYVCSGKNKHKTTEYFKQEVEAKYPNTYEILDEYKFARSPLLVRRIPCQHEYMVSPDNLLRGKGCPLCSIKQSSYMDKVEEYLSKKDIVFVKEKTFEECKNIKLLPFDYYLPDFNVCIEVDGQFHYPISTAYAHNKHSRYEAVHTRDLIKDTFCKTHNIPLIRIPYFEMDNFAQLLDSKLQVNTEITAEK